MKSFNFITVCILSLVFLCSSPVSGSPLPSSANLTGPLNISAMALEYNKDQKIYTAKGSVDLVEGTRKLSADYVSYDEGTQEVVAEGDVVFRDGDDIVECEKLQVNLATKKGTIEKGRIFIKQGNFYITGKEISKVGEDRYSIKDGDITTCGWERPAWKFSAHDVQITVEGYAKTKGARFHILDQTVFYLPWGMFPVKTQRQSGFLLPDLAISTRDGIVFKESYFWAISKDKDATFYLDLIEDRGIKPGAEFRYALKDNLEGEWYGSILDDRKYDHTRYEIKGKHKQTFFKDIDVKLDITHVSDIDYIEDFGQTAAERSQNMLKSTVSMSKPFKYSLLTMEASYFKTLVQKDNDSTFQYLPYISYFTEFIPIMKERFYTDITTDFITFSREQGSTYSRFNFEPKIRLPYSLNGMNFLVYATLLEKFYMVNKGDTDTDKTTKNRANVKLDGDMNMQFLRNYYTDLLDIGDMQSFIKPQVRYTFVPNASYRDIPYIDPSDRAYQTNTITYSINHYLNTLSSEQSRELSLFEIQQTYGISGNLEPSELYSSSGNRFSDIKARLTLNPLTHLSYTNESLFNTYGDGISSMMNTFQHKIPNIYSVNLSHNYSKGLNNELYFNIDGKYWYLEGRYELRYSFLDTMWIDTLYQIRYHPKCWAITLALSQSKRPRDTTFKISFDLSGITGD